MYVKTANPLQFQMVRCSAIDLSVQPLHFSPPMVRLKTPVNHSDHVLGKPSSRITLLEYGDFQCPYCAQADEVMTQIVEKFPSDVNFIFRNFPLKELHPDAMLAAQAAEAAAGQDKYWEMHRLLFERQETLEFEDLIEFADELKLDVQQFIHDIEETTYADKVADDIRSGMRSGVHSTPTFFLNGARYDGEWDIDTLSREIEKILALNQVKSA
jgi:protein-disulfide isomerase